MAKTEIFGVKIEKNPPKSKLTELGVTAWLVWESVPTKMPWSFEEGKETIYIFEGKSKITVDGYDESFELGVGDFAVFPKGMNITLEIIEHLRKYYHIEK